MGAHILPPVPSFYHHPKTIEDIIDQTVGKIFDYFGIEHALFKRWGEGGDGPFGAADVTIV
jgi:4-hydroxy-3-polyprenylbenzoate decarboxylase